MKILRPWLVVSLALNAGLALALFLRPAPKDGALLAQDVAMETAGATEAKAGPPSVTPPPPPPPLSALVPILTATTEPRELVARLRAAGFAPALVQTIVTAMVNEQFARRRAALRTAEESDAYWKNTPPPRDTAAADAGRALDLEHRKLLRDLLGPDAYAIEDTLYPDRRVQQFGNLSPEKVHALRRILADYAELSAQLWRPGYAPQPVAGGREQTATLEKERRAEIAQLLTPAELLDYDLRDSEGARGLRNQFEKFPLTEAEFRALYPAQAAIAAAGADVRGTMTPETKDRLDAARRAFEIEIARVLGETRHGEFLMATDIVYQNARTFLEREKLATTIAVPLVAIQKDITSRQDAIMGNGDLTTNQRNAQLAALAAEANQKLSALLGPAGLETYKTRGGGGAWLGLLSRRAESAP